LTVTADDLSTEAKRLAFTARAVTGSYDAVILSQEQFEKIGMSKERKVEYLQKQLDEIRDILSEKKRANGGKKDYTVKQLEGVMKSTEKKLTALLDPKSAAKAKDTLLEFEKLGFDYLVADECHAYKNAFVPTKMTNVAGVSSRASGRSEDMLMKCDYFNETFGQGYILFASGTPVSNSMTELFVMTRYLRPDLLEKAGISHFDD
jgi:N12 class adenine-specific DNA methylase